MIYCIFCYRDDAELVPLCVERLRQIDADARIYLASDAAAPLKAAPDGVRHITTKFARNGNLNGMPAVLGVLDTLAWCMQDSGADYAVKLDCDTWVNGLDWMAGRREDYVACEVCETFMPGGNCYRMSRWAVQTVLAYLRKRLSEGSFSKTWHYPEDRTVYNAVRSCRLPHVLIPYPHGLTIGQTDEFPVPERVRKAALIHCGEPLGAVRINRAHVALRMRLLKYTYNEI